MPDSQGLQADYRYQVLATARAAQECYFAGDSEGLLIQYRRLAGLRDGAHTEGDSRSYFGGYLQVRCLVAELAADEQRWADWAENCRSSWLLLGEEIDRRAARGWPYNAFIRAKAFLYTVTADGVWKAPEEHALSIVSLNRLRGQVIANAKNFFSGWNEQSESDLRTLDEISWGILHTNKALLRWRDPEQEQFAVQVQREFNLLIEDRDSPLYWDWQIFAAFVGGTLTRQRYRELSGNRRQALRKLRGPNYNLAAYDNGARLEQELFLGRAVNHLRIVEAQAC